MVSAGYSPRSPEFVDCFRSVLVCSREMALIYPYRVGGQYSSEAIGDKREDGDYNTQPEAFWQGSQHSSRTDFSVSQSRITHLGASLNPFREI
jgi:hypothetical protein